MREPGLLVHYTLSLHTSMVVYSEHSIHLWFPAPFHDAFPFVLASFVSHDKLSLFCQSLLCYVTYVQFVCLHLGAPKRVQQSLAVIAAISPH